MSVFSKPLNSVIAADKFVHDESGEPSRPTAAEVRAITEQHAERSILESTTSDRNVDLSWQDNFSHETGIVIDRSTDGMTWANVDVTSHSDKDTGRTTNSTNGLLAGAKHYYTGTSHECFTRGSESSLRSTTSERCGAKILLLWCIWVAKIVLHMDGY